jgi:TRAP-type C4-dicarboxylate transport system permease small subunit
VLHKLDAAVYKVERQVVAGAMAVMGLVVALDVVHRVGTREHGFVERMVAHLTGEAAAAWAAPLVLTAVFLGFFYAVWRARGVSHGGKAFGLAALTVVALYGALRGYVWLVPNGLIWSQTLALALMIWAGLIGASMAAKERRHLALEIGPRLFPASVRRFVVALGHLATAAFCIWLLILAAWSITQHYSDWTESAYEGGTFTAELPFGLKIPKWIAFLAIPYGLGMMALRFLGDLAASLRGLDTGGDEIAAFKKLGGIEDQGPPKP